jgi:tetratricopeptide (TPR) repeat protein
MRTIIVFAAVFTGLTLAAGGRPAGALDYDHARALATGSREKAREAAAGANPEAQWRAIDDELARGVSGCAAGAEGIPCRTVLRFALAGLAELRAASAPSDRPQWLRRAVDEYEAILAEAPDHAPTLRSLSEVHLKLGDTARAEKVLAEALQKHPEEDTLGVLLGDFYLRAKRPDDALRAYAQAAAQNSAAELARQRLVDVYAQLLPQRLADFQKFLAELEPAFPVAAERGYRAIIARTQGAEREAGLVRFVSVIASAQRLSVGSLDTLPQGWAPVAELRGYVETPQQPPRAPWWVGQIERRHVLTEAALSLGRQAALDGDQPGAAVRWEVGRRFAPDYDDYAFGPLKGARVVRLDVQTALALQYFKFPSLDPGERKFNDVIQDLFRSKAGAYAAADLPSIQRHHIILGTIFALKRVWGRSDGQVDAAWFQLKQALATAATRDTRDGTYQPLPEVRALYADTLAAVGQKDQARATYVDAAQAYLDTDRLPDVHRMLGRARDLGAGPSPEQARIAGLEIVLGTREAIAQAAGATLDPAKPEYALRTDGVHAWLFRAGPGGVAKDFADRQRFKALADFAERARGAGQTALSDDLASRAFKTGVDDVRFLVGVSDFLRVERVRKQATQQKALDFKPLGLKTGPRAGTPGKAWTLTDAPSGNAAYVTVDSDDLIAAQVIGELRSAPPAERPDFRVTGGRVVLPTGEQSNLFKKRIEDLPGIKGVVIGPSLPSKMPR